MPKVFKLRPRTAPKPRYRLDAGKTIETAKNLDPRHRLDAGKIIETAKNLADEISVRLSGTNLAGLAEELAGLAVATEERARRARRPLLAIRALSALAISLVFLGLWYLARHIHTRWEFGTINNVFNALNTGFNLLVLLAGALWFCVTLEARIKRKEALGFIEELREFIHAIDVTQLHYTPNLYRCRHGAQPSNPAIDETYLLYSTQMLGVISNLAPLHTRGATGDSILRGLGGTVARDGHQHEAPGKGRGRARDEHGTHASEPDGGRMTLREAPSCKPHKSFIRL